MCLLILSFDSSGVNALCSETEKTTRFSSLPARVTVPFLILPKCHNEVVYAKINCASFKKKGEKS